MIIQERKYKQPSSGAVNWNTTSTLRGILQQISINPSSETTIYNFKVTDEVGTTVYHKEGLKGTYVDDSKIGVHGIYTLAVQSSSASNRSFTVTLLWDEDI